MPIYFDDDISGDGDDVFPSNQLIYAAVHVTSPGNEARQVVAGVPDMFLRIGWIAFGDQLDLGDGAALYWRDPIWLNFLRTLWTPDPSTSGSGALVLVATRVRWHLTNSATAHLFCFGG